MPARQHQHFEIGSQIDPINPSFGDGVRAKIHVRDDVLSRELGPCESLAVPTFLASLPSAARRLPSPKSQAEAVVRHPPSPIFVCCQKQVLCVQSYRSSLSSVLSCVFIAPPLSSSTPPAQLLPQPTFTFYTPFLPLIHWRLINARDSPRRLASRVSLVPCRLHSAGASPRRFRAIIVLKPPLSGPKFYVLLLRHQFLTQFSPTPDAHFIRADTRKRLCMNELFVVFWVSGVSCVVDDRSEAGWLCLKKFYQVDLPRSSSARPVCQCRW